MLFGQRESYTVEVYDENGSFVEVIDYANSCLLDIGSRRVHIKSEIISTGLLEFMLPKIDDYRSDFDKAVNGNPLTFGVVSNSNKSRECKLILKSKVRNMASAKDHMQSIVIPKAKLRTTLRNLSSNTAISKHEIVFDIEEFNEEGNLALFSIENSSAMDEIVKQLHDIGRVKSSYHQNQYSF